MASYLKETDVHLHFLEKIKVDDAYSKVVKEVLTTLKKEDKGLDVSKYHKIFQESDLSTLINDW